MGIISVTNITDGSTADGADVNSQVNTILNEFNGNIDNANIKTGAAIGTAKLADDAGITAAKIAPDAVTDAKLIYGKVRSRQGGSATNWSTAGTNNYDYSGTDVFVQMGSSVGTAGAYKTVTFPTAFNQVPLVIVGVNTAAAFNTLAVARDTTTTTFSFACIAYADGGAKAETINWVAIGQ